MGPGLVRRRRRRHALTTSPPAAPLSAAAGTHSGSFHCDEALGCFLLQQTAKYAGADIVRTRDPAVLETLDVVIDVGGTYEPGAAPHSTGRF